MSNPKRPRDTNQLAKSIVDIATGESADDVPIQKSEAQRRGGLKGAKVRAESLTPKQRSDIAKIAAEKRWGPKS